MAKISGVNKIHFLVPLKNNGYLWSFKISVNRAISSVSSTEKDIDTRLTKAWTAIDRLSIIWKSDLTDKMKRSFFQAAVVSILLYGCTTWTLTKRLERRLDGNYTRMLRAVLNKSWRQHPTRLQLYGHLPPITKTIQVRRTRHAGHCWRSKDELISDVLLWTPAHGCAGVGRPARTYIQQLCEDTGCNPEDLPEAMDDREKWRETVRDIRAGGATWWWWFMGVPADCRDPAPNLYKQCPAPIHQREEKPRETGGKERPGERPAENRRGEKKREERVKSEVKNSSELRVSPRIAGEVKNNPELRVRSKSSIRPDDSVNCAWPTYNQQLKIGTLRIPDR